MFESVKDWLLRKLEPRREVVSALDLEWRVYAQKMNAAGARPQFWYQGCDLNPADKVAMYEFPYGPDSKEKPLDADLLKRQIMDATKATTYNQAVDRLG